MYLYPIFIKSTKSKSLWLILACFENFKIFQFNLLFKYDFAEKPPETEYSFSYVWNGQTSGMSFKSEAKRVYFSVFGKLLGIFMC